MHCVKTVCDMGSDFFSRERTSNHFRDVIAQHFGGSPLFSAPVHTLILSGAAMDSSFRGNFILLHEEEIKEGVHLDTLVPKLYRKGLLTKDEREELLYREHAPPRRKSRLVDILSEKGKDVPRLFIECLREETTHLPHSQLATLLERHLQIPPSHNGDESTSSNQRPLLPHPNRTNATHNPVSAGPSHSPITHHSLSLDPTQGHTSSVRGTCTLPQHRDHFIGLPRPTTHPPCGVPVADSLEELQKICPEFANLVLSISAQLSQRGYTFEDVCNTLATVLENDAIPIQLPSHVEDIPSLCLHLRKQRMCHETDVDLLCELLRFMQQDDLKESVKAYANRVASMDVMQHRYQQTGPSQGHFLAFTFHSTPSLSLGEVCEIKHYISDVLHVPRHAFTLVGSEPGSIGLVWQIPKEYQKHIQSSLEEDDLRASLRSSKYCFESIQLQVEEGSDRFAVFTNQDSKEGTSAFAQGSSETELCPSQEDAISSTTMDDPSASTDQDIHGRK